MEFAQAPSENDHGIANPIVAEAQNEFERSIDWEDFARKNFRLDWMFHNADSENGFQWPDDIRSTRDVDAKPCLTINHTRQHNLMLINEMIDNRPSISIKPTGDGATKAAADVWEGIIRRIEYLSEANDIYEVAVTYQVTAGIGYFRLYTDWEDDRSFSQSLFMGAITDPLGVVCDPDIKTKDGSDAKFYFIFSKTLKKDVEARYPHLKGLIGQTPLGFNDAWVSKDYILEAEYWKKVEVDDKLYEFTDDKTGQVTPVLKSKLPKVLWQKLEEQKVRSREVTREEVWRYVIVGDQLAEKKKWPGKYIPIVRVPGEEYVVDGVMDRRGHTRAMKDPQRMYNYWTSSAVENVALQSKVPWVAAAEATEGYEYMWDTANVVNYSVLTYNALGDDGVTAIPPPFRPQPPVMAQAYLQGMEVSQNEIMAVSGQQAAAMGKADNERTGAAIEGRQSRSDTATSHFMRNFGLALRFAGKIILDVVPHIYDVERVMRIMAENGNDSEVTIDPQAKVLLAAEQQENMDGIKIIFNPNLGDFAVEADLGPGYATKREQSFRAFTQILTQAPNLTSLIGDIMLRAGDFPGAEDAALRLERMVPAQALGTGPSQAEQQLQQQLTQAQQLIAKQHQEIAEAKLRATGKDDLRDVEAYNAETNRLKVLKDGLGEDPSGLAALIRQMIHETLATTLLNPITQSTNPTPPLAQWGGPGGQQGNVQPGGPASGIQVPLGPPNVDPNSIPRV